MRFVLILALVGCIDSEDPVDGDLGKGDGSTSAAWHLESSGTTTDLVAVWAGSDGRYFAVSRTGGLFVRGAGTHGTWKHQSLPSDVARVLDVSGRGATAFLATTLSSGAAAILKLDGASWTVAWKDTATSRKLVSIAVSRTGNVAAVFDDWSLVRFRNGTWQRLAIANPGSDPSYLPVGISAQPGDVFVTGSEFYNSGIYRLVGTSWSPEITNQNTAAFVDLWADAGSDLIVSAGEGGALTRDAGNGWMETGDELGLRGVWGTDANNIYAVGNGIVQFDGSSWKKVKKTTIVLWGIGGVSATDVVAVGAHGTVLHYLK